MNEQFNEFKSFSGDIFIRVRPSFCPNSSLGYRYVWLYNIRIENLGNYPVKLLKRYWKIYDSNGYTEEIEGEGVVGQQPDLESQEVFEYSSQVKLFTHSGLMKGEYTMINKTSMQEFKVVIPTFSLDLEPINYKFKN